MAWQARFCSGFGVESDWSEQAVYHCKPLLVDTIIAMDCPVCAELEKNGQEAIVDFVAADRELLPELTSESGLAEHRRIMKHKRETQLQLDEARQLRMQHQKTHG